MKSSTVGLILGGLAVFLVSFGVGSYYLRGQTKDQQAAQNTTSTDQPTDSSQTPSTPSTVKRPPAAAGEYTAPGAPNISIDETPVSTAKPAATPAVKKPDSESSETGLPASSTSGNGTTAGASITPDPNAVPQSTPDVSDGSNPSTTPVGDDSQAQPASTPVADSGQAGFPSSYTTPPTSANNHASSSSGLYHVQAGAFQSQKNAKQLEDALQSKGYAAMTVRQYQGGRDNYVVQVGAYSSAVTADQMVGNLQRDGFPASVSHGM